MNKLLLLLLSAAFFWGCPSEPARGVEGLQSIYTPVHADGFEIYACGGGSIIKIKNPWQGARGVDHYVFVARGGESPPEWFEGEVIAAPVSRAACMSSSHVAFMDALGCAENIKAVSGLRYLMNVTVHAAAAAGEVHDVGYEGNIDHETLAVLRPGAMFMYNIAGEKLPVVEKMREMRVPVVMIGDYLESSPLGKAEWIVVFGEMTGRRQRAEEIFGEVCRDYLAAAASTRGVATRPGVMLNAPWRDTWFIPDDGSYMANLIRDAGGRYVFEGGGAGQSRAIDGETAYIYARKADYWLNTNSMNSLDELLGLNPNFADVPAVAGGRVWNNTRRSTPEGGSDFWESGAVYPDRVLRDLIHILHPDLLPDHELFYYRKVE